MPAVLTRTGEPFAADALPTMDRPQLPPSGSRGRLGRRLDELVRARPEGRGITHPTATVLPDVVLRYFAFMGVDPGAPPRDVRIRFTGRFSKPGLGWMPAEAWQCNSADPIDRLFVMRVRMARVLPMVATDTYRAGHGEMTGKLFGFTVAHGTGPTFDAGELVTWLNDAVLFAPEHLRAPGVSLVALADDRFEASVTDHGTTVTATITLDEQGAPTLFTTRDRWADLPTGPVRAEWQTPIGTWGRTRGGRAVATSAAATWRLETGPLTYVRGGFDPASLVVAGT